MNYRNNGRKKEKQPESQAISETQEIVESQAIKEKLSEMHNDIKKVMEYTNRLRFEAAFESLRENYSNALLNHLYEDIDTGLEWNMIKKCPQKESCTQAFTAVLRQNAELIKRSNVEDNLISNSKKQLEELRCGAPYSKCEKCFSEVSSLLVKQVNLMRSMKIYAENQEQKPSIAALKTCAVMSEILEPVSNPQRLEMLKAIAFETKSFSAFSELTGLRGGNLLFHLQRLIASGLIMQQHKRGDYMITEKGFKILQGLNEIYASLQTSQVQKPAELLSRAGEKSPI